ncbi:hypothetical protein SLA2020_418880 [Shorea laevis]
MNFTSCFSGCFSSTSKPGRNESGGENDQDMCIFTYNELRIVTQNFSSSNKIGQGGFGTVYKGLLRNGTAVAVKLLSVELESMRGEREFISEIAALSNIKHENLVTLRGCCVEGANRFLVYDYMENNSLAHTLLAGEQNRMQFGWEKRGEILLGIARGLAYLHDEVQPYILHRDIKASNILLDQNFTPKVSDFGLSRLLRGDISHISTHVAGTLGYIAPEYAVSGRLTRKTDVYSFGVLLLEIISGQSVVDFDSEHGEHYLVQKAWEMYKANIIIQLVDPTLGMNYPEEEAVRFMKVGLLCVQETANLRPGMSEALKMLSNEIDVGPVQVLQPGLVTDLMGIKLSRKDSSQCSSSIVSSMESRPGVHSAYF